MSCGGQDMGLGRYGKERGDFRNRNKWHWKILAAAVAGWYNEPGRIYHGNDFFESYEY